MFAAVCRQLKQEPIKRRGKIRERIRNMKSNVPEQIKGDIKSSGGGLIGTGRDPWLFLETRENG